jgi:flagellar motor switch protein FliM
MSDPIITDEEKDALLDGVESGDVEVHADGETRYANVREFEFPPRARIVSNSFPRLRTLNEQLAVKASRRLGKILNTEVDLTCSGIDLMNFGQAGLDPQTMILEVSLAPFEGRALICLDAGAMGQLVEAFFGGDAGNPGSSGSDGYTAGERAVASIFGRELLSILVDTWAPIDALKADVEGIRQDTDVIEVIEPTDEVICSSFDIEFAGRASRFRLVMPSTMLQPVLPALEGKKRERDAQEDARWERVIRSGVTRSTIAVSSTVGEARLTLRDVVDLKPGDVINIDNPSAGRLLAADVPVLSGRFGVHDGHYALAATRWLSAADA